jgi:hypothetical protein
MRHLGLLAMGLGLLAVEGAAIRLLQVEVLRPDPILVLVVFLGIRAEAGLVLSVFALGLFADSFAGTPTGMLTCLYLVVWMLVRGSQSFLLADENRVAFGLLFVVSLVFNLMLAGLLAGFTPAGTAVTGILIWMVPLALLNLLLAVPVWAMARGLVGRKHPEVLFGPQ